MFPVPIFSSNVGVDVGDIGHSLRFRNAVMAYLNRTFGAPANKSKWTMSFWIKRGELDRTQILFGATIDASASFAARLGVSNSLVIAFTNTLYMQSKALFRDVSAPIHCVISYDSANATASNRCRVWINGVEITSWSIDNRSSISAANDAWNTNALVHYIGSSNASYKNDDYKSRIAFIDGTAVTDASGFGYFNTEINEWVSKSQSQVKAVVDAGGTNSFMLDFDDGSSLTTLGYDKSSKGNNWTLNNFSLTAGSTYDWMLDVPGNSFATLNPLIPSAANITNGNLSSGTTAARATMNSTAFDSQWFVTAGASDVTAGVIDDAGTTNTTTVTANKVFAFKMTATGSLSYKNVTDAGSWTSIATGLTGNRWPYSVTQAASWNFGQQPLPEALYTGFKALCQANLPEPAIKNPKRHFDVVLATGENIKPTSEEVFPSNFLEWIKDRANSNKHQLIDIVRGYSAVLQSNANATETTYSAPSGSSVGWLWKAGGAAVTNNAGSIQSQVSANVEAGFSIVTYTGTGGACTVGHGLGKTPSLVIVKARGAATNSNWRTRHESLAANLNLVLNATDAQYNAVTVSSGGGVSNLSSSTFGLVVGTSNADYVNQNAIQYVAYCFAEIPGYSKIGSYTGNGSSYGPFVHCGVKPRFVMVKCSSSTGSWIMYDSARPGYNVIGGTLLANGSGAETTAAEVDFTSSGFKLRVATDPNAAQTYIYYAIADVPGKYSLGR